MDQNILLKDQLEFEKKCKLEYTKDKNFFIKNFDDFLDKITEHYYNIYIKELDNFTLTKSMIEKILEENYNHHKHEYIYEIYSDALKYKYEYIELKSNGNDNKYYPNFTNINFNSILNNKKEFSQHFSMKDPKTNDFLLTKTQRFLKTYI